MKSEVVTRRRCVALIGNPNTGKTTVFNKLTGFHARTGNYPGVTVDNTPADGHSSWGHGFLPLEEPRTVRRGEELAWSLTVSADGHHWTWDVGEPS